MKAIISTGLALAGIALGMTATGAVEPWNLEARQKFAAQRFGNFIHWGLYANYAQGEWYLQKGRLDESAYSLMKDGFCPSALHASAISPRMSRLNGVFAML